MNLNQALRYAHERLVKTIIYPETTWKEAEVLLAFVLKKERTWLVAHGEETVSKRQEQAFLKLIERRVAHEPAAYITGSTEFCGQRFIVNKHVLIPRIETEEMVELAVRACTDKMMVWDVGTGSGAIAISLKRRLPQAMVVASDTKARALNVAKQNTAALLAPDHQPIFFQGSLLTKAIKEYIICYQPEKLVILANLPYLPFSDRQVLQKDVVDYEPASALFAKENGNALILKLMGQLSKFVNKHSLSLKVYFEFDPPQVRVLEAKARQFFPKATIEVLKDECRRERFLQIDVF